MSRYDWKATASTVFQVISNVHPNHGEFHLDSFACQSLNASRVVSFHAVAETEAARNPSEYETRESSTGRKTRLMTKLSDKFAEYNAPGKITRRKNLYSALH